jgi:hypothetical protein
MAMPPQLQRGLIARRYARYRQSRPIAESLPHINVNDLKLPRDHKTYVLPNISLRYPQISGARLAFHAVDFMHTGRTQTFRIKWIKTGFGFPRPAFICECGRPVMKLYFHHANLACQRCCNAIKASQTLNKRTRPILKAHRLEVFLALKTGMHNRTIRRLKARLGEKALMPQSNYGTRGRCHWK